MTNPKATILACIALSVQALFGSCVKPSMVENRKLEREMSDEMRLAMLLSISPVEGDPTPILVTDGKLRLKVTDAELLKRVTELYGRGRLVTVLYDPQSMVAIEVFPPPSDLLVALSPESTSADRIAVQLLKSPSRYYLSKAEPRFHELYSLLDRANKEGKVVSLAVFPGDDEVHDVRIMPP